MQFTQIRFKKDRIAFMREQLGTNQSWALKGLMRIYACQTIDEQATQETREWNDVGFTGVDANLLSSFAEQYQRRGSLSEKQMALVFKKMPKYAKQLESVSAPYNPEEREK